MSTLLVLLFLASLGLLTWGLIAPKSLAKQANKVTKKELTRKNFAVFFGLAAFILFIFIGVTASSTAQQGGEVKKQEVQQTAHEPTVETKEETETQEVPFGSTTVNDGNMAKDTTKITVAGVNGVKTLTYKVTYTDGVKGQKELIKEEVTTQPVTQVTAVGTYVAPPPQARSNCHPSYSGCVPNVSYDLDCADIGQRVRVIGPDVFRLDADDDGIGCDSY